MTSGRHRQSVRKELFRKRNGLPSTAVTRTFPHLPFRKVSKVFFKRGITLTPQTSRRCGICSGSRGFDVRTFSLHKIVTPHRTGNVSWRFHVQPFVFPPTGITAAKRTGYTRRRIFRFTGKTWIV